MLYSQTVPRAVKPPFRTRRMHTSDVGSFFCTGCSTPCYCNKKIEKFLPAEKFLSMSQKSVTYKQQCRLRSSNPQTVTAQELIPISWQTHGKQHSLSTGDHQGGATLPFCTSCIIAKKSVIAGRACQLQLLLSELSSLVITTYMCHRIGSNQVSCHLTLPLRVYDFFLLCSYLI